MGGKSALREDAFDFTVPSVGQNRFCAQVKAKLVGTLFGDRETVIKRLLMPALVIAGEEKKANV